MKSFRCWGLRGSLVDFAEGRLDDQRRESIERHLAGCAGCAATVLSLREVPAELRRLASADPGEEFWARQRGRIRGTIDGSRVAGRRRSRVFTDGTLWVRIAAVAAPAMVILLAVQWWPRQGTLDRPALNQQSISADVPVASSEGLFAEDVFETDEASLTISSSTGELEDLGDFFDDATI